MTALKMSPLVRSRRALMHPFEAPIVLAILVFTIIFLTILLIGVPDCLQHMALNQMVQQRAYEASDYVVKVCKDADLNLDMACVSSKFGQAKKLTVFVGWGQFGESYTGKGMYYRVRRAVLFNGKATPLEVVSWY